MIVDKSCADPMQVATVPVKSYLQWLCNAQKMTFHDLPPYFSTVILFLTAYLKCSVNFRRDRMDVIFRAVPLIISNP